MEVGSRCQLFPRMAGSLGMMESCAQQCAAALSRHWPSQAPAPCPSPSLLKSPETAALGPLEASRVSKFSDKSHACKCPSAHAFPERISTQAYSPVTSCHHLMPSRSLALMLRRVSVPFSAASTRTFSYLESTLQPPALSFLRFPLSSDMIPSFPNALARQPSNTPLQSLADQQHHEHTVTTPSRVLGIARGPTATTWSARGHVSGDKDAVCVLSHL